MVEYYRCDRCGEELEKEHHRVRIAIDDAWDYWFDVCLNCYLHFQEQNQEWIVSDWKWKQKG